MFLTKNFNFIFIQINLLEFLYLNIKKLIIIILYIYNIYKKINNIN